ncbi:MAG: acyl-CoA dehydratase activase-related protein [Bacteroidales bacterium]|jgi:predicted CoA-substrate-specific enzyme activase|nr:acyl-CoA dehydratase activase-related protein [Bacteroidales bacterium]
MDTKFMKIGIDAGSTTVKFIVLDDVGKIAYKYYCRHKTNIRQVFENGMYNIANLFPHTNFTITITGSAGLGIAERTNIPFIQEVIASIELTQKCFSNVRTLIDLGGEDAKIVLFKENGYPDIRMNGNCAGGTGVFIDQIASLLNISTQQFCDKAAKYEKIYPIASRCGVFAKTDIQNLLSRNISISDIAMSTLYAVALQNITTLLHGSNILVPILCIGGPLTFITTLREAFCRLLHLQEEDLLLPENSEYFPAWGAAMHVEPRHKVYTMNELLKIYKKPETSSTQSLPALFENTETYEKWKLARKIKKINFKPIEPQKNIQCFLGIDSGSTTTKIVVIDAKQDIVYYYYANNEGNSLKKVIEGLETFYNQVDKRGSTVHILSSAVTGYGEDLIRSAFNLDYGIVETIAHLTGAQFIDQNVSYILDIGGQDMKSIFIHKGVISNIELNEACSSGCGSFIQDFASSVNMNMFDFSQKACFAQNPSDLGSRCTVFMNSKVKQSLRENAEVGDIAAGLVYSVIKNCLFKVLKISNLNVLGENIVVQGGIFKNDAMCRALELLSGKSVSTTDCPELMGAFGTALYAHCQWKTNGKISSFTGMRTLKNINNIITTKVQCKGCVNACFVIKFKFSNGNTFYSGNKCEKILGNLGKTDIKGYNAFEKKNEILFKYIPKKSSMRIGIPRVLNMFENFPFWRTLFEGCGYEVVLSPESTYELYRQGVGSIMSDNICFPSKLVHGHILSLVQQKVDRLFYPLIKKENKEFKYSVNSFNCPIVTGYPDVIRSSIDPTDGWGIPFDTPVIGFQNDKILETTCKRYFLELGITNKIFNIAFNDALMIRKQVRRQIIDFQKSILQKAIQDNSLLFIVAGRPYHTDPLINQKVGQILSDIGVIVLTDDVFREEMESGYNYLNIVSQWSYPNRVIQSALQVAKLPQNIQMIQLNSFGCGPDSFYMDDATSILKNVGKSLTIIRIDEITSTGSIRLRLRSLVESLRSFSKKTCFQSYQSYQGYTTSFLKQDRKKTILVPWFSDFISPFIPSIGKLAGYNIVNLPCSTKISAEIGLKYGHNDVCYPSTLVLGDIIMALQSGTYDINNIVVSITQTGGQCRATNYISQIKNGLIRAGFSSVPIIALTIGRPFQNKQNGFNLPWLKLADISIYTILYGEAIQQMYSTTVIREKIKGESKHLFNLYIEYGCKAIETNNSEKILDLLKQAVIDFNMIPIIGKTLSKIGVIGEIFVKYNNYAQANISEWLCEHNVEVIRPPLIDLFLQYFVNYQVDIEKGINKNSLIGTILHPIYWRFIDQRIQKTETIMKKFRYYYQSESIFVKADYASNIINLVNQCGEGWTIAADIANFAKQGIKKVICLQPFGCIANHIVAKGIETRLKKFYPEIELLYLDIDSGIAEVNLHNRLHFIL